MRTSLDEALSIEQHLFGTSTTEDRLLLSAKLIIDPALQGKITAQQQAYKLVHQYGRNQVKAELDNAFHKLMTEPMHLSFAQRIRQLFGLKS